MAASGAAAVETPTPAETPGGTPAPEGAGAPASAPGGEGTSGQPAGTAPAAGQEPRAPGEDPGAHVPWPKWRQLNREYTAARREWESQQQTFQRELAEAKQAREAAARYERDYRALEQALRAHPDIAQSLAERLGGAAPGQPAAATTSPETAELLKEMRELRAERARDVQLREQMAERRADEELSRELDGTITKLLKDKHGYGEEFAPMARAYILQRVNAPDMEGAKLEDVPYLLSEWFKLFEGAIQKRINGLRTGVQADQRLPVAPGSTAPVGEKPKVGALDETTSAVLERELAQRLGWHNNGDQAAGSG